MFDSECGSSKEISKKEVIIVHNTHSPPSTQCVYTRGKNIKELGYRYGTERTSVHYEREKAVTSNPSPGFCSVIDAG